MSGKTRMEGCLIQEQVPWETLARAIAQTFEVDPSHIGLFDVENLITPPPPIQVETHEHESGFRMDLTLYIDEGVPSELTGVELASRLAQALGQEVLTSPPNNSDGAMLSPALWVLALPKGELYVVHQINPESDAVEIDRAPDRMEKIRLPLSTR